MASFILISFIIYSLLIGAMWVFSSFDGFFGDVLFWLFFCLSSFIAVRLYGFIRDFFIDTFAGCNKIDQSYIDEEIKKYQEIKNTQK